MTGFINFLILGGAISDINSAVLMPTGIDIIKAIIVTRTDPSKAGIRPKFP